MDWCTIDSGLIQEFHVLANNDRPRFDWPLWHPGLHQHTVPVYQLQTNWGAKHLFCFKTWWFYNVISRFCCEWVIFSKTCFFSIPVGILFWKMTKNTIGMQGNAVRWKSEAQEPLLWGTSPYKKTGEWLLLDFHWAFGGCNSAWDWWRNGAYQPSVISHHGRSSVCHSQTNLLKWQWTQLKQLFHFCTHVPRGISSKRTAAGPWACCY